MMSAVFLEPRWEPCIEKLFALIRLHAEWLPWRGLSANPFEPSYHFLRAFGFDTAQAYLDRASIMVNKYLLPLFHFLHVHQIHLPLFVSVKCQGGCGREAGPSGFV